MKLLFVVNPISGGIDKKPFLTKAKVLCSKYGINYSIFKTTGKNDQENLKKILTSYKPNKVASVGGDGTTLFTSIALLHSKIPMGIIPLGSANGMALELFVNLNPIEALKDLIMSEIIGDLDMVLVNNKYQSIHIGDTGINAQIVEAYEKDENRGMVTYAKYFLDELSTMKPFNVKVEANGQTITQNCVMICICNGRKFGTGVPLNLKGNPMDGQLEIVIVKQINVELLLRAGLSKFYDTFIDSENAEVISTKKATISFKKARLLQLDGEVIGKFEELEVEVMKGAVQLITTNENLNLHFN